MLLFQPLNTLRQIINVTPFDFSSCSHLVVKDVIHNKTRFVFNIQNNECSGVWSPIEMFMNAIRCVALNLSPRSHQWSRTNGPVYRDWDHFTLAWYDVDLIPKFPVVYSPRTACFPCAMFIGCSTSSRYLSPYYYGANTWSPTSLN